MEELEVWLGDPMLKAVVVQQHQAVYHPKIISIPLGHVTERVPQFFKQVRTIYITLLESCAQQYSVFSIQDKRLPY
jgi:hypothetical protein